MVPLLPLFLPLSAVETIATSLFAVMVTVFVNSLFFVKKGLVDWNCFFYLSLGSVTCAALVSYMSVQEVDVIFRLGLALALLVVLFNPLSYLKLRKSGFKAILLGSFGGCLTGVSGVGSAIFSPLLFEFKWLQDKKIVPTVNAVMCLTTVGALSALFLGHPKLPNQLIHWNPVGFILLGSFSSSFVGRQFNLGPYEKSRRFLLKLLVLGLLIKVLMELFNYFF